MFVPYINNLLEERGPKIQNEEHQLAEELVYSNDVNEDDYWVTGHISGIHEKLEKLDYKEFLKHVVQELIIH